MSNIIRIPTQDAYETTLTGKLLADAAALTIPVKVSPSYSPTSTPTRAVINPGKSNMEVVLVESYDSTAKTITIPTGGRAQPLYFGHTATVQEHASGSVIMISDNYGFWKEIMDSVNTKANSDVGVFTTSLRAPIYADATARDAAIPAPTNGMVVYLTSPGQFYDYVAGSWQPRVSGTNPNASETVAGKVEIATDAQFEAGTEFGETGAYLVPKNKQVGGGLTNPVVTSLEPLVAGRPAASTSTSGAVENLINSQFTSGDAGTQTAFQVGTVSNIFSFSAGQDRKINLFIEGGNLKAVVEYTDPTTKTPTPGTVQTIASSVAAVLPSGCSMDNNTVVITFVDGSNDLKSLSATFANATTTVLVPQAEQLVKTGTVSSHSTAKGNTDKLVYVFEDSTGHGKTTIGTLDPTTRALTVAVGNEQSIFAANAISQISSCNAGTDKVFTVFRDDTSGDCTQVAISCGTTTPVPGSPVAIDGNNSTSMDCSYLAADTILVVRRDTVTPATKAKVASITGVTVTNPGTELSVSTVADATNVRVYALSSSEAVVAWRDVTNSKGTFQPISITGTTPAIVGAPVDFAATAIADATLSIAPVNLNKKIAFAYSLSGDSDGYSRIYQNYNNTNRYIGIIQSTVATGVSLTIKQVGVDTNQTGLTPGAIVTSNGIPIGKALTATSMEVIVPAASRFGADTYAVDLGSTDDYVFNVNPAPTAYVDGQEFKVKFNTANTGASTASFNGLAPLAIKLPDGTDTPTGIIRSGMQGTLRVSGSTVVLIAVYRSPSRLSGTDPFDTFLTYTMLPGATAFGWTASGVVTGTQYVNGYNAAGTANPRIYAQMLGQSASVSTIRFGSGIDISLSYYFTPSVISAGATPYGAGDVWFWHGLVNGSATPASDASDPTSTTERCGFSHYNGRIYTITSDGSTIQANNIQVDPGVSKVNYQIRFTGTSQEFYINGVLVATHTTTFSSSNAIYISQAVSDQAGNSRNFNISNIVVSESLT